MKTIAWDVDDVLNELMRTWLEREWRPKNPSCSVSFDDLDVNPPHERLGVTRDAYLASLDRFRATSFAGLAPVADVLAWMKTNGSRFRHVALTAAPLAAAPHSAEWVMRHFGTWIPVFCLVPSPRDGVTPAHSLASKSDLLSWCKADALVDDNTGNVDAARALGMKAFLMPQPWNRARATRAGVLEEIASLA